MMLINFILGGALPIILFVCGFYLIKTYRDDNVIKWVRMAVTAAEQIYKGDGKGAEKFAYVEKWISEKFRISPKDLKNIIESAVFEVNKEVK